jgi:hypothetical protein
MSSTSFRDICGITRLEIENIMARIGPELTQRMVIYQWVCFPDELGVLRSLPGFRNLKDIPNFEEAKDLPLLGYVYVDHEAGISLKVEGLFFQESEQAAEMKKISEFIRDSVSLKFRYDVIQLLDLHILNDDERERLSLPDHPDWLQFYESPELNITREDASIDHLRAEGFFDDVQAVIPPKVIIHTGSDNPTLFAPEFVWIRLASYSDVDKQFKGFLLNQPHQEFGMNKGEMVLLSPMKSDGNLLLIVKKLVEA